MKNPDPHNPIPGALFHSWWDNFDKNVSSGSVHTAQCLYAKEKGIVSMY